jgi:hypothetical protein
VLDLLIPGVGMGGGGGLPPPVPMCLSADLAVSARLDGDLTVSARLTGELSICPGGINMNTIAVDSDNVITVSQLYDSISQTFQNSAQVTALLMDRTGTNVLYGPLTLNYLAGSNGTYQGTLPNADTGLMPGTTYVIQVTAIASSFQLVLQDRYVADFVS